MTTLLAEKTVTARKEHTCGLCVLPIKVGQQHYTQTVSEMRDIWTWRAHSECWSAWPAYARALDLPPWTEVESDPDEFREFTAARDECLD